MYNYSICMQNCFLICFNGGFFTNQVTNVLTEVVPFCKSGHKYSFTSNCYSFKLSLYML